MQQGFLTQSGPFRIASFALTGSLKKGRISGSTPDLLNKNLNFNEIPQVTGMHIKTGDVLISKALFLIVIHYLPILESFGLLVKHVDSQAPSHFRCH